MRGHLPASSSRAGGALPHEGAFDRSRWTPTALILTMLLGLLLRLVSLDELSLRGDEVMSRFYAQLPVSDLMATLGTVWAHPPLFYLLFGKWLSLAGESAFAFRFPAIVGGVLIIPLTYQLARELLPTGSRGAPAIAALLAAVHPFLITDSQDARVYSLFFALSVAATCCLLRGFRRGWSIRLWLGYVLCATLALYSHYLAAVVLIIHGFLWLARVSRGAAPARATIALFVAWAASAALFAPWVLYALPVFSGGGMGVGTPVTFAELVGRTFAAYTIGLAVVWTPFPAWAQAASVIGFLPLLLAGSLALASSAGASTERIGQASEAARWRFIDLLLFLVTPAAVLYAFGVFRYPIYDERYALIGLAPFLVLAANGIARLIGAQPWRWLGIGCFCAVISLSGYSLFLFHSVPEYSKSQEWRQFVDRVLQNAQPGDILVQNYPDPALPYHLDDRMARVLLPVRAGGDDSETALWLRRLAAQTGRVWFQPQESSWDPDGVVQDWLDRRAFKVGEESIGLLSLSLYVPVARLLGESPAPAATLGDAIELLGWRGRGVPDGLDPPVDAPLPAAGEIALRGNPRLEIALFWRARRMVAETYTVFVHVYRPDGSLCAQQDNPPAGGREPTNRWQPGDIVVDTYQLPLTSCAGAGKVSAAVGMYRAGDTRRLPVLSAAGLGLGGDEFVLASFSLRAP
jgi:4-amino-4-deoxy-L-arabinose transferase-like glycosyltransferase